MAQNFHIHTDLLKLDKIQLDTVFDALLSKLLLQKPQCTTKHMKSEYSSNTDESPVCKIDLYQWSDFHMHQRIDCEGFGRVTQFICNEMKSVWYDWYALPRQSNQQVFQHNCQFICEN